jgi:hypothetical protein
MDPSPESEIGILLAALEERYEAMRIIRSRTLDISLWVMGAFFGAAGWIITSDRVFPLNEKFAFILTLATSVVVVRFFYLRDLEKGFRAQQRVAARIEESLGLYTAGRFGAAAHSMYPSEWLRAGSAKGGGKFFQTSHFLIYVATAILAAAIISKGNLIS